MGTVDTQPSLERTIRALRFFGFTMIASCIIFLLVSIFLVQSRGGNTPAGTNSATLLLGANLVVGFICLLLAKRVLTPASRSIKGMLNVSDEVLGRYRRAFLGSLLLQEVAVWGSLMLYVFTTGFPFLVVAAVLLGVMIAGVTTETRSMLNRS